MLEERVRRIRETLERESAPWGRAPRLIAVTKYSTVEEILPLYDLGVTVTQGGRPLESSWVVSDHFTSSTVITSQQALIAPGAVDMQVFLGFVLAGEGDRVEITLSRKHTRAGDDPYCGTFVVDLPALR